MPSMCNPRAGQDTRAGAALTMAQGEKKGRCLGLGMRVLWFARVRLKACGWTEEHLSVP